MQVLLYCTHQVNDATLNANVEIFFFCYPKKYELQLILNVFRLKCNSWVLPRTNVNRIAHKIMRIKLLCSFFVTHYLLIYFHKKGY